MYLVAGNKNSQTSSLIAVKCNLNTIEDGSVLEGKRVPIEELDVADIAVMWKNWWIDSCKGSK